MNAQLQILITFLLYLTFFAWIGWQRGNLREAIVFGAAVVFWVLLQEQGDLFVRLANLGGKFATFLSSGGLSEDPDQAFAALGAAPPVITNDSRPFFLFILWVVVLIAAYVVTNQFIPDKASKSDGWAVLLGIANALFYASALLPRLIAPLVPEIGFAEIINRTGIWQILSGSYKILQNGVKSLWTLVEPQAPIVFLLLLTLLLLIAATSLKDTNAKDA